MQHVPRIVLSKINPVTPPTNMEVDNNTVRTLSTVTEPGIKTTKRLLFSGKIYYVCRMLMLASAPYHIIIL